MTASTIDQLVRLAAVTLPLGAVGVLVATTRPGLRQRGAALLGTVAAASGTLVLNAAAAAVGWWGFREASLVGQPLDLVLAWAVLWGAVPALLPQLRPLRWLALLAAVDLLTMPLLAAVGLGRDWLVGEFVGLGLVALPVALLVRWTVERRHLHRRVVLQVAVSGVLWFGTVPVLAAAVTGLAPADGVRRWLGLQLVLVGAVLALAAVREFLVRGQGTPWPWDPPRRVVTSGPYRHLRNPMQLGGVLVLLGEAVVLGTWFPAAVAVVGVAFSCTAALLHEDAAITSRHPEAWPAHRRRVRAWLPHWRARPGAVPGVLWVDEGCAPCSSIGRWVTARHPVDLEVRPVADRDDTPSRAVYEGADGHRADGVAAIARALEHTDLGLALCGWTLLLPGVRTFAGVVGDLAGFGPREVSPDAGSTSGRPATSPRPPTTPVGGA